MTYWTIKRILVLLAIIAGGVAIVMALRPGGEVQDVVRSLSHPSPDSDKSYEVERVRRLDGQRLEVTALCRETYGITHRVTVIVEAGEGWEERAHVEIRAARLMKLISDPRFEEAYDRQQMQDYKPPPRKR